MLMIRRGKTINSKEIIKFSILNMKIKILKMRNRSLLSLFSRYWKGGCDSSKTVISQVLIPQEQLQPALRYCYFQNRRIILIKDLNFFEEDFISLYF